MDIYIIGIIICFIIILILIISMLKDYFDDPFRK